jgi:hypothetical protein
MSSCNSGVGHHRGCKPLLTKRGSKVQPLHFIVSICQMRNSCSNRWLDLQAQPALNEIYLAAGLSDIIEPDRILETADAARRVQLSTTLALWTF